ncbi:ADP-forming succinate--CoA ligase subunit beta [Thiohalocapsa marina]|uniref:Succinate--CoA ligase [ADP-forming] subunit beta n=1 Tax=Thiohalocapsa marina TaxID=424902 RepID=A0A5M8FV92_9GAMM|nr:ADP-forming succinate--CoA ligase subunit beta [Thiohalocapsa marina]KAA6187732.1 ADP-forming succinate--CoA ligase subunit beta [Thiohalocapsa marina]
MNLHEFQAKELFRAHAVGVPDGVVARSPGQALAATRQLGGERWVVKAQVHAGGRGKAGGVVACDDPAQVRAEAARLLGSRLQTAQTGADGLPVDAVLVEAPTAIARELYLGLLVDRAAERIAIMASTSGGMDIEAVAARDPSALVLVHVDPVVGLMPWQGRRIGFALGLDKPQRAALQQMLQGLYRLFVDSDASLVEINPLVVTAEGGLLALDAKVNLDANALYRQPALEALRDSGQEDPRELAAAAHQLNYISLDGNIGCMVNGAGLAMATMDLVKLHGGAPANFLDVGGGTTAERVAEAFKLVLSDPKVCAVLVNIFGGIVRCDLIAEGIIRAVRDVRIDVPLVVRLQGTKAAEGRALLADSGLELQTAGSLSEAADKVVAAAAGAGASTGSA